MALDKMIAIGEVNNGWTTIHGPMDAEHHLGEVASKLADISSGVNHMKDLQQPVEAAVRWAGRPWTGTGR